MKLVVTTPDKVVLDIDGVAAVRAEDPSGWFGILPGHADLLTVLAQSVMVWRGADGAEHFVAVRGGVLTVRDGREIAVATREAFAADDMDAIAAALKAAKEEAREREASARTESAGLEAAAVRRIQDYLESTGGRPVPPGEV
jgi:F-type H+-transporting ATPase subunit epsilon